MTWWIGLQSLLKVLVVLVLGRKSIGTHAYHIYTVTVDPPDSKLPTKVPRQPVNRFILATPEASLVGNGANTIGPEVNRPNLLP